MKKLYCGCPSDFRTSVLYPCDWTFFFLLPSLYVFVVNPVGFEIQISSHRVEEICIWYGWTKLHYCGVALNLFWRDCAAVVVAQKKIQGKPDGHRSRLLCSAKSAVICNDSGKQASSSSHQDADTPGHCWKLRHSILMFNIQKIKIVYRWYWKEGFEEIIKSLNL